MKLFSLTVCLLAVACFQVRAQVPASQHVYILLEENHSYESVLGQMPYLNSLASQYALLTNSYANSHYSIPNYMWLTTGAYVTTNDNTQLTFDVDNITRHLATAGLSWKEYAEGLPYAGYVGYNLPAGCTSNCVYVERHNPFPYFTEVANGPGANNIVPFTQFAQDLANGTLPNYAFITPNLQDDDHDGTPAQADAWLQVNLAALLATPAFQPGGDGILIITFDESFDDDCRPVATCPAVPENQGGGRIYTVVIGPQVKPGYQSNVFTEHQMVLRTMMEALGLTGTGFPGATATVFDLADVFAGNATSLAVTPTAINVSGGAAVQFAANKSAIWSANGGTVAPTGMFTAPTMLGAYTVTATDAAGNQASGIVNVIAPPAPMVNIMAPASGASVTSPVTVTANFVNGGISQYMKLWVDGIATYFNNNSTTLTYTLALAAGNHQLSLQAYNGTLYRTVENITVTTPPATTPSVTFGSPAANASLSGAIPVTASFNNGGGASYMKLWIDGVSKSLVLNTTQLGTSVTLPTGKHKLTVQAYNGTLYSSFEYVTVQ